MVARVLVIDDDAELGELLEEFLGGYGIAVDVATDARVGLRRLAETPQPDLVVLDVMLPGENGFATCAAIRAESSVPIIMLTAVSGVDDKVRGLQLGADDYLAKPFEPRELIARIRSVTRRGPQPAPDPRRLAFEDLEIDLAARRARLGAAPLALTEAEFDLLALFAAAPQRALTREHLAAKLRGNDWEALDRSLDMVMSRLRQKLRDDPKRPRFFRTIWGTGYMFIGRPA